MYRKSKHDFTLYVFDVEWEHKHIIRNEFGYVKGHEPGTDKYLKAQDTLRVRAPQECYARAWVEQTFAGGNRRNVTVTSKGPLRVEIDAIVSVSD